MWFFFQTNQFCINFTFLLGFAINLRNSIVDDEESGCFIFQKEYASKSLFPWLLEVYCKILDNLIFWINIYIWMYSFYFIYFWTTTKHLLLLHLPYLQNSCKYFKHYRVLESKSVVFFFLSYPILAVLFYTYILLFIY